jgi:hypothetical protein
MSTRPVPVPTTCSAVYAVMTPEPLDREDHLEMPSAAILRHRGTSDAALARLARCPHQRITRCDAPPQDMGRAVVRHRTDALALAEAHDGVVVDLMPARVLELRADEVSLSHAAQWFVLDHDRVAEGLLQTDGLHVFGLPELRCRDVLEGRHAMTGAIVTGLAHRLIAEWPEHDPVGPATVTLRDIAFGLGDPAAADTPVGRSIDLRVDYDPDEHLLLVTLLSDPAAGLFAP